MINTSSVTQLNSHQFNSHQFINSLSSKMLQSSNRQMSSLMKNDTMATESVQQLVDDDRSKIMPAPSSQRHLISLIKTSVLSRRSEVMAPSSHKLSSLLKTSVTTSSSTLNRSTVAFSDFVHSSSNRPLITAHHLRSTPSPPSSIVNMKSSLQPFSSTHLDHITAAASYPQVPYTPYASAMATYGNTSLSNGTTPDFINSNSYMNLPYDTTEIVLLLAFFTIFIFGTVGNGYIYYYFGMKKKSKRSIPELLFSYLAMFDFTASVINPMLYIYFTLNRNEWSFGEGLCKSTLTLGSVVTTISGGIFIIIAFDRERCIVFPFKSHYKTKTIKICVVIAIVYAILMNFHYALNLKITPRGHCTVGNVLLVSYWVPTIICFVIQDLTLIFVFAFTNMRIFDHIKSKDNTLALGALWGKRKKDSAKIIRLLVALATVFFVLTLPRDIFLISHMLSWVFGKGIVVTAPVQNAYFFIKVLHTANSCVNVFIYYRMHRGFRRHVSYHVLCFIYGTEPKSHAHFLDTLITAENSPNLLRKIGSPIRSRSTSREVATVDERLINSMNQGRKRTIHDRRRTNNINNNNNRYIVSSPVTNERKPTSNLLTVVVQYDSTVDSSSESDPIDAQSV